MIITFLKLLVKQKKNSLRCFYFLLLFLSFTYVINGN